MSELTYEVVVPNDCDEELRIIFNENTVKITLDDRANCRIYLTHEELNSLHGLLEKYRNMLKMKVA